MFWVPGSTRMEGAPLTAKCSRCGGTSHATGALHGLTRASFRPDATRFLTLETSDVMTRATMCRGCGLVEITGDVRKLARLTAEAAGPDEPAGD